MSRLPLRLFAPVAVALIALVLRLAGGPGGAYLHGIGGVSDEPAYIGEALYLDAAIGGRVGEERFFSQSPPLHQLLLSLAPILSPFRLETTETAPAATLPAFRSPGGRPHTIAYLPAGSEPDELLQSLGLLARADISGFARESWLVEANELLARGEPVILSVLTPGTPVDRSLPIAFAVDPALAPGPEGLSIVDRATGTRIATLPSGPVRSIALAIGADDPLSISIATIDASARLRVWRMTDQAISPWGAALLFSHEESFTEAASVAPGPSGDLLLVSARTERGWELLTYETTSSISLIGRLATDGPLQLDQRPDRRETIARAADGTTFRVVGGPIFGARLVVALIGALGALLAWLFGSLVGGRRLAFGAGLLFALDPLAVAIGRSAYQEATVATMIMGALAATAGIFSSEGRRRALWFVLFGLFAGLASATKGFVVPLGLFALYVGATRLPAIPRMTLAAAGGAAGLLFGLLAVAGSTNLGVLAAGAVILAIVLARSNSDMPGWAPLLLIASGVALGYLVPWLLRGAVFGAAGWADPLGSVVQMHLDVFAQASRASSGYISTWWIWPSGLSAIALNATEIGSVFWVTGVTLAAGIAASTGARTVLGRWLGVLLLLLWVPFAILLRDQMPYYAIAPGVVAIGAIVVAARERPLAGQIAIPLALLAPLAGALAYETRMETALIALPLSVGAFLLGGRMIGSRSLALPLAVGAWVVAALVALGISLQHGPELAPIAGLAAALAARGGWRAAPAGAALAGVTLLLPEIVAALGFMPSGGLAWAWSLGAIPHLHPIGLTMATMVVAGLAWPELAPRLARLRRR